MNINWDHFISNEEVLARADVWDIELKLVRSRLRWLGHASRMDGDKPVKALLYGELANGSRPVGRPQLRFKDTCKSVLKCGGVLDQWRNVFGNRSEWRQLVHNTCKCVNEKRIGENERRRGRRKLSKAAAEKHA